MKESIPQSPTFKENIFQNNGFKESGLKETGFNEARIKDKCANDAKETLGERLRLSLPKASREHINKLKGNITEKLVDSHFKRQGWHKLEGEYGVNGIDGLYVKYTKDGAIEKVMIAESKYNTSRLGDTRDGKQMSKEWILSKLEILCEKNSNNKEYAIIKEMVEKDCYRSRLVNVKEVDDKLSIRFHKIDKEGNMVELNGREMPKVNGLKIDLNTQNDGFESKMTETYKNIVNDEIAQYKENGNSPYKTQGV